MLHVPDDIRSHGPSWVYWCFVMERYCGSLLPSIKSRSNPYPSMTKRILEGVQVSHIKKLYPQLKSVLERPSRSFQSESSEEREPTTTHETVYPECEFSVHFRLFTDPYIWYLSSPPYRIMSSLPFKNHSRRRVIGKTRDSLQDPFLNSRKAIDSQ